MVHALVNISEKANWVLNVIKAKYDLKDKSQAIEKMAEEYESLVLETNFKPEFISEIQRIRKGKFRTVESLDNLLNT